jgi:hypothetical protein
MKKFVICLFAVSAALTLAIGASAFETVAPGRTGNTGIVGAAEDIVGGAVNGVGNVAGGVVRGANDVVHGVADGLGGDNFDNKDGVIRNGDRHVTEGEHDRRFGERENEHRVGEHERNIPVNETQRNLERDRNPSTGIGLGIFELAAIGTTVLGTAALAGRKRK